MAIWVGTLPLVIRACCFETGRDVGWSVNRRGWNSIGRPHQLFVFDEYEYDDDPTTPKHFSGQVATCTFTMQWNNNALYYIIDLLRSSFAVDGDDDLSTKQDPTTLFLWAETQAGKLRLPCVTPPSGSLKKVVLRISFMRCYIIIIIHYCFIAGWMSRWQIVCEIVFGVLGLCIWWVLRSLCLCPWELKPTGTD